MRSGSGRCVRRARPIGFNCGFVSNQQCGAIWRIFFSPDGKHLAVCYDDGASRILDMVTGEGPYRSSTQGAPTTWLSGRGPVSGRLGDENAIGIRNLGTWGEHRTLSGNLSR